MATYGGTKILDIAIIKHDYEKLNLLFDGVVSKPILLLKQKREFQAF